MLIYRRSEFETEHLTGVIERLSRLDDITSTEQVSISKLEDQKQALQEQIDEAESALVNMRQDLAVSTEILDEKTKEVENVKRTTSKAGRALDAALKEITMRVRSFACACIVAYVII